MMKCWRCNCYISDDEGICSSCGISLLRTIPSSKEGSALRKLYDRFGAQDLLSNPDILIHGFGDYLPDERNFKHLLNSALAASIGELYLLAINQEGSANDSLVEEVESRLYDSHISQEDILSIMNVFDEMIGWSKSNSNLPSSILAIQFCDDCVSIGTDSIPPYFYSIPISRNTNNISIEESYENAISNILQNQLKSIATKTLVRLASFPCSTVRERAWVMKLLADNGIPLTRFLSPLASAALHIDAVIRKGISAPVIVLCIVTSGTSYDIGMVEFSQEGIVEVLGVASHKSNNHTPIAFDSLQNDIYQIIDSTHAKPFSRIAITPGLPNDVCNDLSTYYKTPVVIFDKKTVLYGLLNQGAIMMGQKLDCLLLEATDYSIIINNVVIIESNTTIPTSRTASVEHHIVQNNNFLTLCFTYFLDYNKSESIQLPINPIVDNSLSSTTISVTCSIDNNGFINVFARNNNNNKSISFDWSAIQKIILNKYKGDSIGDTVSHSVLFDKASAGDPVSQNLLGYNLQHGYDGYQKNCEEAIKWYRKAADKGNSAAMNNLGICYINGYGVEKDYDQAIFWFKKSADQGNMYGEYDLANCYENGVGIHQNIEEAKLWYTKAAEQGLTDARDALQRIRGL